MEEKIKETIEKRKENIKNFLTKKNFITLIIGILILLFIAWNTRTVNIENLKDITTGDYTLGPDLDPFLFLRYAKYIVENGKLMDMDMMRFVPLGYGTSHETKLLPYMMAYFHNITKGITGKSINYSSAIFPAFMFLLTVIAFFLFIRKVFDSHKHKDIIAFVSSLFLIVSPSLLSRTVAGIPEKESVGFFFLFLAFYFFLCSWKAESLKKGMVFAFLSGLSTALMGLIWGGWIYIFATIASFTFVEFVFNKIDRKKFYYYTVWIFVSFVFPILFSQRYNLKSLAMSPSSGVSLVIFFILLIDLLIFNTRIKNLGIIEKARQKMPDRIVSITFSIALGIVLSSIFFEISFIPSFFQNAIEHLTTPYVDRLSFTVAENRQPYFGEWEGSFGPMFKNIPLFFWLFFLGSILLFYDTISNNEKKSRIILVSSYILFIFGLIFSRYAQNSVMNGVNFQSEAIYFGSFILIATGFLYVYYNTRKEDKKIEINSSYLFLLAFFIISLIGARSAIRLIMTLATPASGIIGFFAVESFNRAREEKGEGKKIIVIAIAALVIIASLYTVYTNYKITIDSAKSMVPSIYTQQWQEAMMWVRNNTGKSEVFSHWWDYGYWLQSIGERPTILDGGNAYPYWNHLFGRHVLTAKDEKEALEFLYTHNASYLLIDSSDIGKYAAYSSIGSDENYDRYSWIGTFLLNEKATEEKKNETLYYLQGGIVLDEDYMHKDGEKQTLLPAGRAGIGALVLKQDKNGSFKQPEAIFVYNGNQFRIPLRYLYYEKLYDFSSGYNGGVYLVPKVIRQGEGIGINNLGSAMFLSERNTRALWVKLYLLNQTENFQLVHSEDDFLVANLKQQGAKTGDFVLYDGIRGPIKIWKINYPSGMKINEEYLKTDYPDIVRLARPGF